MLSSGNWSRRGDADLARGRLEIPPLELEVGLVGEWARFWYPGELLGLPVEVERERDKACQEANQLKKQLQDEQERSQRRGAAADALVLLLRPLVEERARRANRQDSLDALPTTTDSDTFRRWLEELP